MRLKLGRPDLAEYADLFAVPEATGALSVTFLGVSTLLFDDGESAILTDGFFSRPSMAKVLLGRIGPDPSRIEECLDRAGVQRLEAVLPVHSHFDHALDSAYVAERTGARLVGGTSTANLGRGQGLTEDRIEVVTPGTPVTLGTWRATLIESTHCPPDRYPGTIDAPLATPARTSAWKCGEAWSILLTHTSGVSALVLGSAGYVPGSLAGRSADVVYLGVGQLGLQPAAYLEKYWHETVTTVGATRVVLTHWDDFFRPLDQPLRALPYAGDDLDRTLSVLGPLATADGVDLQLPSVWQPQSPWR